MEPIAPRTGEFRAPCPARHIVSKAGSSSCNPASCRLVSDSALVEPYGTDAVFMNVDIISPGSEFAQEVKTALGQSHAVRSGGGCRRGERQGTAGNGRGRTTVTGTAVPFRPQSTTGGQVE